MRTFTIHICSECGRVEGESPQAGCCPGCGRASEPYPVEVVLITDVEQLLHARIAREGESDR